MTNLDVARALVEMAEGSAGQELRDLRANLATAHATIAIAEMLEEFIRLATHEGPGPCR